MFASEAGEPASVLLVEDHPETVMLMREAVRDAGLAAELEVVGDGDSALRRLREPNAPRPRVVLLDLNLPGKSGRDVLAEVKLDPELRPIPIVILTTSVDHADVELAYHHHANAYVRKPVGFDDLVDVVRRIDCFWLRSVTLPPQL